jgi:uncharacterized oxidoreductase
MKLQNKKIVITGGTSGIGLEMTKQLSENNTILVIARQQGPLKRLKEKCESVVTYQADLSNLKEVEAVADRIVKEHESIDVLINNAAVQYTPSFLDDDFSYDTIKREIDINFTSVCSLIYLLLPSLIKDSRSLILNLNSGLGLAPKTSSAIYCGTKGALNIFSQSLGYQLEKTNIRVLQAFMPLVDTPMTKGRGTGKITVYKAVEELITGLKKETVDIDVGKVKLLRILMRVWPGLAKNILKRG